MAGRDQFTAAQFIEAIPGTGGVITALARRVGCNWQTAKKYVELYPTVKAAYNAECESVIDLAESVVVQNIKLAYNAQAKLKQQVDSADAKWYLSRKGKARGYNERQEVTGADGGPVNIATIEVIKDYGPESDGE